MRNRFSLSFRRFQRLGVPIRVKSRMQLNLVCGETKFNADVQRFDGMTVPVIWIEIVSCDSNKSGEKVLMFFFLGRGRPYPISTHRPSTGIQHPSRRSEAGNFPANGRRRLLLHNFYCKLLFHSHISRRSVEQQARLEEIDKVHGSVSVPQPGDGGV